MDGTEERRTAQGDPEAERGTSWISVLVGINEEQGLGSLLAFSTISGILILLFPFIGGAIGGARGATTGQLRP